MAAPEDAGSIYSDIRIRLDKLNGDILSVKSGFDKMNSTITTGNDKTTKTLTKNFDNIKLAGTGAIIAITLAFKQSIKTFADTEQQLANVRAVSNATAKEFGQLEAAANKAGVSTRFTASEAADALFFLSSAGFSATQSVEALDGVLLLAGATGSGLAESSQAITSTLAQFGLEASKAADVSNIFAAANSNSQATLEKLSSALRQVGPVAGQFGIGLEETTASLEALFNAGLKGESAGAALRNILLTLSDESGKVTKAFIAQGGAYEDINPQTVGLTTAMENLSKSGIDLSSVFEKETTAAALILGKAAVSTDKNLRDLEKAITGTNEAARQYAIQNDTLAGSQDAFKSALQGVSNSLIEQLTPILRGVIDLGTGFLKLFNSLPSVLKGFAGGAGGAALGVGILTKSLAVLGVTLSTGPLGVIALLGGVVVGLSSLVAKSNEVKQARISEEFGDLARELGYVGQQIDDFTNKAGKVVEVLKFLDVTDSTFGAVTKEIEAGAEALGLTTDELIAIGLKSKDISKEFKGQLTTLQNQLLVAKDYNDEQGVLADLAIKRANGDNTSLEVQRQRAKIARDEADAVKLKQEREVRLLDLNKERLTLNELFAKGLITEEELLENKIALRESEKTLLLQQAIDSGTVTAQVTKDIQTQQYWIDQYNISLGKIKETKDEEVVDEKDRTEEQIKADEEKIASIEAVKLANETTYNNIDKKIKESTQTKYEALTEEYNAAISAAEALGKDTTAIEKYYQDQKNDIYKQGAVTIAGIAQNLYNTLNQARIDSINGEIAEIERLTAAQLSAIDTETQALLTALGLQDETKLESLQTQLDAAILAGETETAAELEKEIQKTQILQDADDRKQAIEEASNKKTAKLKYEAEIAAWEASKLNTAIAGAQAAISAYGSLAGIPIVGPALGAAAAAAVGIATGVQIGVINKNKPKQTFATGGIVLPERGVSSTGDNIRVGVNPKEMILNQAQQAQLFNMANGGSGNSSNTMIQLFMDSKVVAQGVARNFNNGIVKVVLK